MIKAIITDFDGTLIDTKKANALAYVDAFNSVGVEITEEQYNECFGLRFDDLCKKLGVTDKKLMKKIKAAKQDFYPTHFDETKLNATLIPILSWYRDKGVIICVASTASPENIGALIDYYELEDAFDGIICGEDVKHGKPKPDIYLATLEACNCEPDEVVVFEDSDVGIEAAQAAGITNIIKVKI